MLCLLLHAVASKQNRSDITPDPGGQRPNLPLTLLQLQSVTQVCTPPSQWLPHTPGFCCTWGYVVFSHM